ncbi:Hypothetical predicted protein, partial [Pelobates cultripes]
QAIINSFIWENKRARVAGHTLYRLFQMGGMGVPHVATYRLAAILTQAVNLHADEGQLLWVDMERKIWPNETLLEYMWSPPTKQRKTRTLLSTTKLTVYIWDRFRAIQSKTPRFHRLASLNVMSTVLPWLPLSKCAEAAITKIFQVFT